MTVIQSPSRAPRVIRWSFVIAACAGLFVMIGLSTARETYQEWKVDQEIQGLQAQVDAMEGKKIHLNELIQKLQAPDTLDKEARMRFGLRKPGERVMVLRGFDGKNMNGEGDALSGATSSSEGTAIHSNPQKWFAYFFVGKN